jgi:hypothetical protein
MKSGIPDLGREYLAQGAKYAPDIQAKEANRRRQGAPPDFRLPVITLLRPMLKRTHSPRCDESK